VFDVLVKRRARKVAPTASVLGATVVLIGLLVLLLGPVAWWATPAKHLHGKEKADVRNATRQTLLAAAAGTAALIGLGFTGRAYYLSRRGQLTDRYAKAISQLASDKLTERLGGIYALEHVMIESARDQDTIIAVLSTFVREGVPITNRPVASEPGEIPRLVADVQAALTVIGRRPARPERNSIDLSRTDLSGAQLFNARLDGAFLNDARLQHANLAGARLKDAFLLNADLQGAILLNADLQDAILGFAQLQGTYLAGAHLKGTHLVGAQLGGANLASSITGDLKPVKGMTLEQLSAATIDQHTELPPSLRDALDARGPTPT
jgi:Pentapeptide repeats (8 copies)